MKTTTLTTFHRAAGAKMVDFAGYEMPVHYGDQTKEHMAVRENVGLFDVSHMGEFIVKGEGALAFLQWMLSNDISRLKVGDAQYNYMPNQEGGIVDDLLVYRLGEDKYMLVVNASNIEKDWNWLNKHNTFDCHLRDVSDTLSLIAVQGPKATDLLKDLTDENLSELKFYTFREGTIANIDGVIISATGYTGAGGFELYVDNDQAADLWKALTSTVSNGVQCCGLGARDSLRLEKAYCLYGNDIDETTSPFEAGLGWVTKLKAKENIAQAVLLDKKSKIEQKLVGFQIEGRRIARQGMDILNSNAEPIGRVTSGGRSPILNKAIGLGYVDQEYLKSNNRIWINLGRKIIEADIVKTPFV